MTGKYQIVLYNNKIQYRLSVERNLTLLRGDSATGKSELIRLLTQYNGNPHSSGITLLCDKECIVLNEGNWRLFLQTYHGRIFFIDVGNSFLRTQEFADEVKCSDNYFVIISRESLPQLPYIPCLSLRVDKHSLAIFIRDGVNTRIEGNVGAEYFLLSS